MSSCVSRCVFLCVVVCLLQLCVSRLFSESALSVLLVRLKPVCMPACVRQFVGLSVIDRALCRCVRPLALFVRRCFALRVDWFQAVLPAWTGHSAGSSSRVWPNRPAWYGLMWSGLPWLGLGPLPHCCLPAWLSPPVCHSARYDRSDRGAFQFDFACLIYSFEYAWPCFVLTLRACLYARLVFVCLSVGWCVWSRLLA